ncbi:hypothetical protein [Pseudonocardia alni]|uniref:hypothetical protein n=1 Tax=Pseudonocardia alni TaxID=33907 RepID=UPI0033CB65FF
MVPILLVAVAAALTLTAQVVRGAERTADGGTDRRRPAPTATYGLPTEGTCLVVAALLVIAALYLEFNPALN